MWDWQGQEFCPEDNTRIGEPVLFLFVAYFLYPEKAVHIGTDV